MEGQETRQGGLPPQQEKAKGSTPPVISIVIPAYNVENHIQKTLLSVAGQDACPRTFEIIVINDGSNDGTRQAVETFMTAHPRLMFTLLNTQNQGVSSARNLGIQSAQGEYLYFLDGDDFITPDLVSAVQNAVKHEKPDVVLWGYEMAGEDGGLIGEPYFTRYRFPDGDVDGKQAIGMWIGKNSLFAVWTGSGLYRREPLIQNGIAYVPGCSSGEDTEFQVKAIANAAAVSFLPKVYSFYLQRAGSVTRRYNIRLFENVYARLRALDYLASKDRLGFGPAIAFLAGSNIPRRFLNGYRQNVDYLMRERKLSFPAAARVLRQDLKERFPTLAEDLRRAMGLAPGKSRLHRAYVRHPAAAAYALNFLADIKRLGRRSASFL